MVEKHISIDFVVQNRMCQGCGACEYACSSGAIQLTNVVDEGIRPTVNTDQCSSCGDCVTVCSGTELKQDRSDWSAEIINELANDWGPVLELWEGYAADDEIRFQGGSGGGATAMALFAVERKQMHGVLHVGMDADRPWLNQTVMSGTREELINRTGSRYAPAAVCAELGSIEEAPAPCVMIAKPCDVAAARKAAQIRPKLAENLGLTISIFCGGTPSTQGTFAVMDKLGVKKENVADLRYRGRGWPGMTGVNLKSNSSGRIEMTYHQAWDTILTKHKPMRCHVCPDGTGEFADIACGDPWYRTPDPSENGSTLFVIRTQRGRELFRDAMACGYIVAERRDADVLPRSQKGLLMRRSHIWPKFVAARLFRMPHPTFNGFPLRKNFFGNLKPQRVVVASYRALRAAFGLKRRGPISLKRGERVEAGKTIASV